MSKNQQTVTVRRTLEYKIDVPSGIKQPVAQAAIDEAMVSSTAEADREEFEVIFRNEEVKHG